MRGLDVAKVIQASLGSTEKTLDRPSGTRLPPQRTFPYPPPPQRPLRVPRVGRVPREAKRLRDVKPPQARKPVQILIKLLVP